MLELQIHAWEFSLDISYVMIEPQSYGSETCYFHCQEQCVQWQKIKDTSDVSMMTLPSFGVLSNRGRRIKRNTTHSHHRHCFMLLIPKKSSSNCWQAFICHSLMWSYSRTLGFTVTKCNNVFSGNQHHRHKVHIQRLWVRLFSQECVTHHIRNNELERMYKELLCLIVCNYYSIAWWDSVQSQEISKQLVSHQDTSFKPRTSWPRNRNANDYISMQTRRVN
jgi:hypothetical protein